MSVNLEGKSEPYEPKDTDEVRCEIHGIVTTWGKLTAIQRLAVEEGLDTIAELPCLLSEHEGDYLEGVRSLVNVEAAQRPLIGQQS